MHTVAKELSSTVVSLGNYNFMQIKIYFVYFISRYKYIFNIYIWIKVFISFFLNIYLIFNFMMYNKKEFRRLIFFSIIFQITVKNFIDLDKINNTYKFI